MSVAARIAHPCVIKQVLGYRGDDRWQARCLTCGWHGGQYLSRTTAKIEALKHYCKERFE